MYYNPNKVADAEQRVLSLRQDSNSLPSYIAKFDRILGEAEGHSWDDKMKIMAFTKGLDKQLQTRLRDVNVQQHLPKDYASYVSTAQQLSS